MASISKKIEMKPVVETYTITRMTVMRSCVKVFIYFFLTKIDQSIIKGSKFITLMATDENEDEILLKGNASGKQFMVSKIKNRFLR